MKKIVVVGSVNVDATLHLKALPKPGETIAMTAFSQAGGGKGANQAVAASRNGGQVHFIGRLGQDDHGDFMRQLLEKDDIETRWLLATPNEPTGQAYILLQENGQNSIVIQHGANFTLTPEDILAAKTVIQQADCVIAQFETPIDASVEAFALARQAGVCTILNPAPAHAPIPQALLKNTDLIAPNETESAAMTGLSVDSEAGIKENAAYFHRLGIRGVIMTLGHRGAYYSFKDQSRFVPAFKVKVIDTTAAGDTFIGALASELKSDFSNLDQAIVYASKAASYTVQTLGALPSIPNRAKVVKGLMGAEN